MCDHVMLGADSSIKCHDQSMCLISWEDSHVAGTLGGDRLTCVICWGGDNLI